MINELKKHIRKNNENLIEELIYIIEENNIESLEELGDFEDDVFFINNKRLNKSERVEYATTIALSSYWDYDGLLLDEINRISELKDSLKTNITDDEKIFNIIKLFDLTGNECLFLVEAYNLIITEKY